MGGGLYLLNPKKNLNELLSDLKKPTFSAKIHLIGGLVMKYNMRNTKIKMSNTIRLSRAINFSDIGLFP